jgi:hypothetical protein
MIDTYSPFYSVGEKASVSCFFSPSESGRQAVWSNLAAWCQRYASAPVRLKCSDHTVVSCVNNQLGAGAETKAEALQVLKDYLLPDWVSAPAAVVVIQSASCLRDPAPERFVAELTGLLRASPDLPNNAGRLVFIDTPSSAASLYGRLGGLLHHWDGDDALPQACHA